MKKAVTALALGLLLSGMSAFAQDTTRIRGTLDSLENDTIDVTPRGAAPAANAQGVNQVHIAISGSTRITGVKPASLADIRPGSYVGTVATPLPDGSLRAREIHIFPASMHGTGEGQHAWDQGEGSSMTNATVEGAVASDAAGAEAGAGGHVLTLEFGGRRQKLVVPDGVPVVAMEPGGAGLLVPNSRLVIFARQTADGRLSADRIAIGENGTVPPM